jgi:hypothetical protein
MVGINVHGPEWSTLAKDLLTTGKYILCGDYSAFGPTLMPECVLAVRDIVNAWYDFHCGRDEEANLVRTTLFYDLLFCKHVASDTVYRTFTGSPSGAAITAEINSLVNMLYMCCAWQSITGLELRLFREKVCGRYYGDDVIMSVSEDIIATFNNQTIEKFLKRHNITYTDITKTGEMLPYRPLAEATFLKCSFIRHPSRTGMYLGSLDKQVVKEICMWVRSNPKNRITYNEASLEASDQCIRAAYSNGPDQFAEISGELRRRWAEQGEALIHPDWDYLDRLFMDEGAWLYAPKGDLLAGVLANIGGGSAPISQDDDYAKNKEHDLDLQEGQCKRSESSTLLKSGHTSPTPVER